MGTISNPPKFRGENGPGPVSVDDWNDFYKWLTGMWRATRDTSATVRPPADFPPSVGVPLQRDPLEGSIFPPPITGVAPGGFPAAPLAFPGSQVSGLAASAREIESLLQTSMARVPYPVQSSGGVSPAALFTNVTTPSRALGTGYQNSTGLPMMVTVTVAAVSAGDNVQAAISPDNFTTTIRLLLPSSAIISSGIGVSFLVPAGYWYEVSAASGTIQYWTEIY